MSNPMQILTLNSCSFAILIFMACFDAFGKSEI